jgi:hypothetical protein
MAFVVTVAGLGAGAAAQNSLFIAQDLNGPIKEYNKVGGFIQDWAEAYNTGATGPAVGGGNVYSASPSSTSTIFKVDASDTLVSSYSFVGGGDPNGLGLPGWIEDAAYAGSGELWIGGYNGMISHIDSSGAILSQFNTKTSYTGVAFDGKTLYTTHGFYGGTGDVEMWDTAGNHLGTIATGFDSTGGIGWDSDDNTLWVGYLDSTVRHFDMGGTLLGSFITPLGNAIDGLEVGKIPAPGAGAILGLAALTAGRRRR